MNQNENRLQSLHAQLAAAETTYRTIAADVRAGMCDPGELSAQRSRIQAIEAEIIRLDPDRKEGDGALCRWVTRG